MAHSEPEPTQRHPATPNSSGEPNTQAGQADANVPVAPSIPPLPPTKAHCSITCKTEKTPLENFKDVAEIIGICLLAVYTCYTIKMYCANRKAADAATTAAKAASASVKQAQQAFHLDQRAWIVALPNGSPDFTDNREINIPIRIENTGKTPALGVAGNIVAALFSRNERPEFIYTFKSGHPHYGITGNTLLPYRTGNGDPTENFTRQYAVVEHGKEFIDRIAKPIILTHAMHEELSGEAASWVAIFGEITYADVFDVGHWTHFCYIMGLSGTTPQVLQQGKKDCVAYNDVDKNDLQPPQ